MTRCAITHFDGDPFILDFWLLLYKKYWKGEVNTVYTDVCYDPSIVTPDLVERQKTSLARFPEIKAEFIPQVHAPEYSNPILINKATEDDVLLIESDGWIFGRGVVDKYFKEIEENKVDIVAGNYQLLPEVTDVVLGYAGFMRNFFFINGELLWSLDLDLCPRHINDLGGFDVDCFGYISYQLALKKPRVLYIPCNFVQDPQTEDLVTNPWLHIRQMNSSFLGFGNAGNGIFKGFMDGDETKIAQIRNEVTGNPHAIWLYRKVCAMRLLMIYVLCDLSPFAEKYKQTIKKVVFDLGLDWDKVQGLVTYYRTVMKV